MKKYWIGKRKENWSDIQWDFYQSMMGNLYDELSPTINLLLGWSIFWGIVSIACFYLVLFG